MTTKPMPAGGRALAMGGVWLLSLWLILIVSACEATNGTLPPALPQPTTLSTTVAPQTPVATLPEAQSTLPDRQLLLWAPPFFADLVQSDATTAMTDIYAQFERAHPGVHVEIQLKNESGEASMLNYLRSAERLAPTILPDLILLESQQLWQVADLELTQPITITQLPNVDDLFPFTLVATTYEGELIGIPYATDLLHLVYHKEGIETPPSSWRELVALGLPYSFIIGKNEGLASALFAQYLSAGGFAQESMSNNPEALRLLFTFAAEAKAAGVITEETLTLSSLEQIWERFTSESQGLANTSTRLMLSQLDGLTGRNIGYAHLPTSSGGVQTVAQVWAFAIITTDPEQARLALDLIDLLREPAVHSAWGRQVNYIPAGLDAFEQWRTPSDYYDFLRDELAAAVPLPNGWRYMDFNKRLQQGYEKVVRGEMTPEEATIYVEAAP